MTFCVSGFPAPSQSTRGRGWRASRKTSINRLVSGTYRSRSAALRRRHVALPFGTRHGHLPLGQIDVGPLERHHLAAAEPGLAAQQDDEQRRRFGTSRLHEPFELVEVVEA